MHKRRHSTAVLAPAAAAAALLALPPAAAAAPAGPVRIEYVHSVDSARVDEVGGELPGARLHLGESGAISGHLDLFSGVTAVPGGVLDPLGLSGQRVGGTLQGRLRVGERAVTGAVDYRMDRLLLGNEPFRLSQDVSVGPRFSILPGSTTELFYRRSWSQGADGLLAPPADADSAGAGLAQTWHFLDSRGRLRLEYGVHEGREIDAPMRAEGQALSLSGTLPLRWGIDATFEADYRTNTYADFPGAADLESVSTAFRAGVNARLGDRLRAGLNFSYADEDFDADLLPQRRSAWGVRLRYDP